MVTPLTRDERIFLAGCIKTMMLSDGSIENQEILELDDLISHLNFSDFDQCLEEFETRVQDEKSFWEMAASIERPAARDIILESVRVIMLHAGIPGDTEGGVIRRLEGAWRSEQAT